MLSGVATGDMLPSMIVFKGTITRCIASVARNNGAVVTYQAKAWVNEDIMKQWITKVWVQYTKKRPSLLNSSIHVLRAILKCFNPRGVYSARKLSLHEKVSLDIVVEDKGYTCGVAMFPLSSRLADTVVVRQNIGCANPMETRYYSAKLISFLSVCYFCGAGEEILGEVYFGGC